jgi:hypothetical protein
MAKQQAGKLTHMTKAEANAMAKKASAKKATKGQHQDDFVKAFADAGSESHTVWVAKKESPKKILGYIEAIEDNIIVVGVEGSEVGHYYIECDALVLWGNTGGKPSRKIKQQKATRDFAFNLKPSTSLRVGDKVADVLDPNVLLGKLTKLEEVGGVTCAYVGNKEFSSSRPIHELVLWTESKAKSTKNEAFKFPTRKSIKALKEQERVNANERHRTVLIAGDFVEHPAHGAGVVTGVTDTADVLLVSFTKYCVNGVTTDSLEVVASELKCVNVTHVADAVMHKPKEYDWVRFAEIGLLEAFERDGDQFVKVGNSSAVKAVVQVIINEPFAMLATKNAKLPTSAKQRFRQKDRVIRFYGNP